MDNTFINIFIVVFVAYFIYRNHKKEQNRLSKNSNSNASQKATLNNTPVQKTVNTPELSKDDIKLETIRKSSYSKKALLNKTESEFFYALLRHIDTKKYGVFAQVPVYALVKCDPVENIHMAGAKYFDFVIFDRSNNMPLSVIEVHGSGHNLNGSSTTAISDKIKEEVAENAGIIYHSFHHKYTNVNEFIQQRLSIYH